MHPQSLLLSNPPLLSEQLMRRTNELRCKIVRANCNTQFAQAAPELTEFRRATANLIDGMDDHTLSDAFQKTVHFTAYDSYAPFIAKLFEKPCKASAIVDLLAPGLPDFVSHSSSTSGGIPKTVPRYRRLSKVRSLDAGSRTVSDPLRRGTTACLWNFRYDRIDVEDEENCLVKTIYLSSGTALNRRLNLHLDPEKDGEKMGTFILDHAAPYAAGFINKWRSFILIHVIFAVGSRSLETISVVFINTFVDMMRHLDAEFDLVVDCIANGTIPDLEGIEEVRHYLEPNLLPDPERAAELRSLGRPSSRPGWCGHVWPNLRAVAGTASGSFASSLPLAQWYLGPNTDVCGGRYACTESGMIALPYNPLELNQYKLNGRENIIEFLDISKNDDSVNALTQPWEVQVGRRYEVVSTTQDGLWRYRLGDVVEIAGFDPTDGVPIIQFVERRNVVMRFPFFMVTEKELRDAMSSVPQNMLGNVVDWTATVDNRGLTATMGFFVELASDQVSDLAPGAADHIVNTLSRSNPRVGQAVATERACKPTIRLIRSGTFSDFQQLRLDEGSGSLGQIKVPVVLPNAAYVTWFLNQVVHEL